MMAGLTPHSQKAVFQTTALQEILKLPENITRQAPALLSKHVLEPGPVFFYQLIKQRVLGLMSLGSQRAQNPDLTFPPTYQAESAWLPGEPEIADQ
jgi:hypothetical protein